MGGGVGIRLEIENRFGLRMCAHTLIAVDGHDMVAACSKPVFLEYIFVCASKYSPATCLIKCTLD